MVGVKVRLSDRVVEMVPYDDTAALGADSADVGLMRMPGHSRHPPVERRQALPNSHLLDLIDHGATAHRGLDLRPPALASVASKHLHPIRRDLDILVGVGCKASCLMRFQILKSKENLMFSSTR